jgi:cytochrome c-type biogenesis protein CcmF
MIAEIGIATLGIAFASSVLAVVLALGNAFTQRKQWAIAARNLLIFTYGLLTVAITMLVVAQWIGDYSIAYVRTVSSNVQPDALKITALWGSQAGSLLFYGWMLSMFVVLSLIFNWRSHNRLMGWVMFFAGGTLAFFLMLSTFYENPFERTWMVPNDPSGAVETALFQPDGMEVAHPWRATSIANGGQTQYPFFHVSETEPPFSAPNVVWEVDGGGLNPLLRHPGMIVHPPTLYLGFTGFLLPFAFAMAAMIVGQSDVHWMRAVRRWTLVSWLFLSIGLILGGRWAYDVLGWGGYWGWDPVENSSLLPWFTGTAFLHSVMIQEKRGMLKGWNMSMVIVTFMLVMLGTVATRTGLLSSVHTFAESPLAVPMGIFFGIMMMISVLVYLWRGSQGYFKNDHEIEGLLSRESMFLLNNWVFFALTVIVFWGTWAEKITDLAMQMGLRDNVINLGPEYYETPVAILFLVLFVLMGVAPLVAWRRATARRVGRAMRIPVGFALLLAAGLLATGTPFAPTLGYSIIAFAGVATFVEIFKGAAARHRTHNENWGVAMTRLFLRDRRRYGGYMIHLGVLVIGIGVIASTLFQEVQQTTMDPGDEFTMAGYTMRYERGTNAQSDDGRIMSIAEISLWRDGEFVQELRPRRDFYSVQSTQMLIAGVHSNIEGDFYVRINHIDGDEVTFAVYNNPLVGFVWWGGIFMIIGTVIATWPTAEAPQKRIVRKPRASTMPVGAGD